ncbi:MAG: TonB-dependent receptor [Proteobacteria bacterium]|nr:TonB-dependent receptor [Pseudomonadota bacterium]
MNTNRKISCAIAAILGATAMRAASAGEAAGEGAELQGLQEITVTAQRRKENIQDVPITIQAMTGDTLKTLGVSSFDDLVKYLPNVSLGTNGPAQGNIFMRGLALGSFGSQASGTLGNFPNVAVYLDEQSGQIPGRNLDIMAVDLERVEILEGPQGTLFGGGAQAGVLRYITNKPKLNKVEGTAEAGYGITAHGDPNSSINAVLNLPLVADTLAARLVIYNESRGGYIDNVPSTFTRRATDYGIHYAGYIDPATNQPAPPPNSPVINNYAIARRAINPVHYQGLRASLLWQVNDDWNALLTQSYQNMEADGVFFQFPKSSEGVPLQPLEVTLFNDAYNKDRFTNTALTVTGQLGPVHLTYTGGYLVRHIDQVSDYTNYARGVYADYYQCYGAFAGKPTCFSPSSVWHDTESNTHQSHELRLNTPDDKPVRGIVGAFWEDFKVADDTAWDYKTIPTCVAGGPPDCFQNVQPVPGSAVGNPNPRGDSVAFFEDTAKTYRQTAFFASLDFDLIPKVLTLTAGTRHYDYHMQYGGTKVSSFGCFNYAATAPSGPCTSFPFSYGWTPSDPGRTTDFKGFTSRVSLTWHITPGTMTYATWSQGYRPGAVNTSSGFLLKDPADLDANGKPIPQYIKPLSMTPDTLTNKEIGFKSEFLNHRVQVNGSIYQEDWNHVQTGLFNPLLLGNTTFGVNGANYRVRGLELQLNARVISGLTITGSASWNRSEQLNSPFLISNNPASRHYGQQITQALDATGHLVQVTNTFGNTGVPTAYSPPLQFNLRGRYDWAVGNYGAYFQLGVAHTAHFYNNSNTDPSINGDLPQNQNIPVTAGTWRFEMPGYSTWDAALGVSRDNWNVQLYGQNLSNENASVTTSTTQFIKAQVPLRPRVLGVKFGLKF